MNHVVVVTCERDRWQFKVQCWSMGKFLEPVCLHIVINENHTDDWLHWYQEHCAAFLDQHQVKIYTATQLFEQQVQVPVVLNAVQQAPGWHTQQLLKLLVGVAIQQEYTVLDSKNWFVKPCSITEFQPQPRTWNHHNTVFDAFYSDCITRFKQAKYTSYRPTITPFHFDPDLISGLFDLFGGVENFICWFLSFQSPSEFIVYDLFAQSQQQHHDELTSWNNFNWGFWLAQPGVQGLLAHDSLDLDKIKVVLNSKRFRMLSIQPALLQTVDLASLASVIGFNK
jgi:hypothetical protein